MRRLIKKSNEQVIYEFQSPITLNFSDDFSSRPYTEPLNENMEFERTVKDAIADSMSSFGPKGLAEYLDEDSSYFDKIESIFVSVKNGYAITTVKSNEMLSENELDDITEYITGQFADGWGEGLEQIAIDSWTDTYQEDVEDEDGEVYQEDVEYEISLFVSLWNYSDWKLTQL